MELVLEISLETPVARKCYKLWAERFGILAIQSATLLHTSNVRGFADIRNTSGSTHDSFLELGYTWYAVSTVCYLSDDTKDIPHNKKF